MKKLLLTLSLLCFSITQIEAIGAGLFLYRHLPDGSVDFLFASDPYQHSHWRQGFDVPAGTIGDHETDNIDPTTADTSDDHLSFLRGGIREGLEELAYVPTKLLIKEGFIPPAANGAYFYKKYMDNKGNIVCEIKDAYEKAAVDFIEKKIKNKPVFYLRTTSQNHHTGLTQQFFVFFLDVTDIAGDDLPKLITQQRNKLPRPSRVGAEPDEIAWINSKELSQVTNDTCTEEQRKNCELFASYWARDKRDIKINKKEALEAETNRRISLSPASVELLHNREQDKYNPQQNRVILTNDDTCQSYDPKTKTINTLESCPHERSSSMAAIISLLTNKNSIAYGSK